VLKTNLATVIAAAALSQLLLFKSETHLRNKISQMNSTMLQLEASRLPTYSHNEQQES